MTLTVVIYHSGYGHTQRLAQHVADGADAQLIAIDAEGNIGEAESFYQRAISMQADYAPAVVARAPVSNGSPRSTAGPTTSTSTRRGGFSGRSSRSTAGRSPGPTS